MRTLADFERAVEFLAGGGVDVDGIVTHRFPLAAINEAMDVIGNQEGIKAMIDPSG